MLLKMLINCLSLKNVIAQHFATAARNAFEINYQLGRFYFNEYRVLQKHSGQTALNCNAIMYRIYHTNNLCFTQNAESPLFSNI